jgi:hypothetical protein
LFPIGCEAWERRPEHLVGVLTTHHRERECGTRMMKNPIGPLA